MNNFDKLHEELENFENVKYRIRNEGFHYCFKHYSSFEEIEDEEFHRLRHQYLQSSEALEQYVETQINEINNNINEKL